MDRIPKRYSDNNAAVHAALCEMFGDGYVAGLSREASSILMKHLGLVRPVARVRLADDPAAVERAAASIHEDYCFMRLETWHNTARNALSAAERSQVDGLRHPQSVCAGLVAHASADHSASPLTEPDGQPWDLSSCPLCHSLADQWGEEVRCSDPACVLSNSTFVCGREQWERRGPQRFSF